MPKIIIILIIALFISGCDAGNDPVNYYSESHICKMADGTILPTFDDGPNENTAYILDKLKEYNLKAAFFVIGKNAAENPELLQRIVNEGHYLGNHTYNHIRIFGSSWSSYQQEIIKTQQIINNYTSLKWFRPPCGEISVKEDRWLSDNGYTVIRWTIGGSLDMDLKPGDIILMHDHDDMSEIDIKFQLIKQTTN